MSWILLVPLGVVVGLLVALDFAIWMKARKEKKAALVRAVLTRLHGNVQAGPTGPPIKANVDGFLK